MTIELAEIWDLSDAHDFKAHLATWNGEDHPLDAWVRNPSEWQGWQEYRPQKNDFNRKFIFSLMQFYPEKNSWLFGGIFRVIATNMDSYEVSLSSRGEQFIGRLKIGFNSLKNRNPRQNLDNLYKKMYVREILPEKYQGQAFPGLDNIIIGFSSLRSIIVNDKPDWKSALSHLKGIYLITDTVSGLKYVGSAYGTVGIWSRWSNYIETYHGGNKILRNIYESNGPGYFKKNFKFTILEVHPMKTADDYIIARENFWKDALDSRGNYGMNIN